MKAILMCTLSVFIIGCTSTVNHDKPFLYRTNKDFKEEVYCEYFSNMELIADNKVIAHSVITLGKQRLPRDVEGVSRQENENGVYDAVSEVLFKNISKEQVTLLIDGQEVNILPDKSHLSKPSVGIASNFHTEAKFDFKYEYKSKVYRLSPVIKRVLLKDANKTWERMKALKHSIEK